MLRSEGLEARRAVLPARGVAAHRGGPAERPENTLAAFRHAAAHGVHQVEFDVRRSADGELVVIHDATVDRTTNGRGKVAALSLAALQRLDAGGSRAPERIPTLREALDVLPQDLWINIQIKRGEPIAEPVARTVVAAGRLHQAIVAGGNDACRAARTVSPDILLCNLARQRSRTAYLDHAIASGASFLQLHHLRGPVEARLIVRAHAAGLRVNFFCAPNPSRRELRLLFDSGVDFVLVDDLRLGLAAARDAEIEPLARGTRARGGP